MEVRRSLMKSHTKHVEVVPPQSRLPRTRRRLSRNPIILAGAGLAMLFASSYCGVGYLHYKRVALYERFAAQRAERANIELQDTLDRLRNNSQRDIQQLKAERDHLRERVSEVEQKLWLLEPELALAPIAKAETIQRVTPAPAPAGPIAMGLGSDLPASELRRRSALVAPAAARTGFKNFTSPYWVPDFFSGDSGPVW
jgi:hypothetical protein